MLTCMVVPPGELDLNEMRPLLGSLGLSLDEYGLQKLFIIIDSDGSGTCSKDELLAWRLEKFYEDNPEEMAKNLYLMFVGTVEDDITVQQFKEVLLSFNDPPYDAKLSKEEVHMIVDEFDEDGSGYITFEEFLHAIKLARNME
jgi:Ca2+-binding EF-hand superfamily protein